MRNPICPILLWFTACAVFAAEAPDLILHDGKIVTVDSKFSIAQAVATRGERIIAVGTNEEVLKLAGPQTRLVDLGGKTVLPGLIDSHVHAVEASVYDFDHPIPEMNTIADVLGYIKSRAAVLQPGEWILVSQVFITRLKEQRFPTRAELDAAAPQNPVVFRTGPDTMLNSMALKLQGIDRNYKLPPGVPGLVERDPETDEPTGMIRKGLDLVKFTPAGRKPTFEDRRNRMKMLLADYNAVGITGFSNRSTSDEEIVLLKDLRDRGELTCRVFVNYFLDPQAPLEEIAAKIQAVARSPLHEYDNLLWVRGAKVFLDGGMLTGSAFLLRPWGVSKIYSITDPEYRGVRFIEPAKLYRIAALALRNGLQLTAHAVGDGAVTALIDAFEEVNNEFPVKDARPCISHSNFMTLEAIERMSRLGIVADMQPAWLERDGATLMKQFGAQRLRYFQPYKTLFEKGVTVGGGSDHMQRMDSYRSVNPYNPFFGMWIALARRPRWTDAPLHPEERITREQVVRLYTINNAYLTFEEKEKGSIENGKLADFVVLRTDILTCPLDAVKNIQVDQTYLGGKLVYQRR